MSEVTTWHSEVQLRACDARVWAAWHHPGVPPPLRLSGGAKPLP